MFGVLKTQVSYLFGISRVDLRRKINRFILLLKSQYFEFTPEGGYLKVLVVGGKCEGAKLEIFGIGLALLGENINLYDVAEVFQSRSVFLVFY